MENLDKDIEYKIRKADDLIRKGQSSSAVSIIKEAINFAPEMTYLHYLLGIARMKCGRFFLAKKALEKADQLEPNRSDNLRSLGWVKVMLGNIEEARTDLRKAISLDLTDPLAYVDLAMSYFHYYEFKEGFEWIERAKALDPNNPYILSNYQTAKETEKEFLKYSKKQLEKMRKEKLNPEAQKGFQLSILRKYSEGRTLNDDEIKEIGEELKLGVI